VVEVRLSDFPHRGRRLKGWLTNGHSDHSIAEAIGIAVAVLYVPLLAVSILVGAIMLVYGGVSGIPAALDAVMTVQTGAFTGTGDGLLGALMFGGVTPVLAALYAAALYTVLSRRRAILIGWVVFTTLSSFASHAPSVGEAVGASGSEAILASVGLAWPIVVVPLAIDYAPRVVAAVTRPEDRTDAQEVPADD